MSNERDDNRHDEEGALRLSAVLQEKILERLGEEPWRQTPAIALHGLIVVTGEIAAGLVRADARRSEWVLEWLDRMRARVLLEVPNPSTATESRH